MIDLLAFIYMYENIMRRNITYPRSRIHFEGGSSYGLGICDFF